ncbi:MAG: hypothetical protein OHK0039_00110 [Bacteroidia bacterium]
MEELFKKFLYTGVGIVALTAEKLQEAVDELVGQGKVSKDEGKKIVDDFVGQVEDKRSEMEVKIQEMIENLTESINLPRVVSRTDLDAIVKRLEAIEARLGIETAAEVQAAVQKNVVKKAVEQVQEVAEEVRADVEEAAAKVSKTTKK